MSWFYDSANIPALSSAGAILSGAKLYAFDAGTTNPVSTYTTASLATPNAWPVVASAAGRFPAVYLNPTVAYRIKVTNAAGTDTLYDRDRIEVPLPAGVALSTTLAADGGAALVGTADGETVQQHLDDLSAIHVAGRSALAAISAPPIIGLAFLYEPGRAGMFRWDNSNLATKVAADTAQGIYVAPSSDTTGASGAWVRQFSGPANLKWWGAVADDVGTPGVAFGSNPSATDNANAIEAALACLKARTRSDYALRLSAEPLLIDGWFYTSRSINLKMAIWIVGQGTAIDKNGRDRLRFPANTDGIIINHYDTLGNAIESPPTTGAGGALIDGIWLLGGGGTTGSGIRMRDRARARNVYCENWGLDGCNINCSAGGGATDHGNANLWWLEGCTFWGNGRHGVFCGGGDSNAGNCIGCDASFNACGGFIDASFLGSHWFGCHTAANGITNYVNSLPTPIVNYAGHSWSLVVGCDAIAGSTTPGTDPLVWVDAGTGVPGPTWTPGITVRSGAPYGVYQSVSPVQRDAPNSWARFYGCYGEGGQTKIQIFGGRTRFDGLAADNLGHIGFGVETTGSGNRRGYDTGAEFTGQIHTSEQYFVDGLQVVTNRQAAIADDATAAVNKTTVNAILNALRAHGLIA